MVHLRTPQGTMLTPFVIPLHYSSKKIVANMSPPPLSVGLEPYLPRIPGPALQVET